MSLGQRASNAAERITAAIIKKNNKNKQEATA